MEMIMLLFSLFGPLYGHHAISPLNFFKGTGIVIPAASIMYSKDNDSTIYLTNGYAGLYYNYDQHISFGIDFNGRFYYIQSDTTLNRFYPDRLSMGVKFGFPLAKTQDMGIATYVAIPVNLFTDGDSTDLMQYPLSSHPATQMAIYHFWKVKRFVLASQLEYRGAIYKRPGFSINFSTTAFYELQGLRLFLSPAFTMFTTGRESAHPKEVSITGGVSFISPFNASFTIDFTMRPLVKEEKEPSVFLLHDSYKYGLGLIIESWFPEKKYKRRFTPRKEKPARFVLLRRFRNITLNIKDKEDRTELKNVKIEVFKNQKLLKSITFPQTTHLDSLKSGIYTFVLQKERYITKKLTLDLKKDTTLLVYMEKRPLKDTGTLTIHIKDENGVSMKDVKAYVVDLNLSTYSDTSGTVQLRLKSGKYLIRIMKRGYKTVSRYFVIGKEENKEEAVILKKR